MTHRIRQPNWARPEGPSRTEPLLVAVHLVAPEFYAPIEKAHPGRRRGRRRIESRHLADVLGTPAEAHAAEEMLRIAHLIRGGRGWIACTPLPAIGDLGFDHRALAIVGDCPPAIARLAVATGAWFSQVGSCWSPRQDQRGFWQIDSDDENMTARCAPVVPGLILEAWANLRRVMVVHARKDDLAVGYIFEPQDMPSIGCVPLRGER